MKKLLAVPAIAILAAAGAASAAGFAGGVSAAPIQTGDANDLTCASSARIVEYGNNDHVAVPFVDSVKVQLNDAECQGQAVHVVALKADGTELDRFKPSRVPTNLASGTQYVTLYHAGYPGVSGIKTTDLDKLRVSIDGGYAGIPSNGSN
jgi:hypothetical protein